jgi:hypothetical protein
MKLKLVIIAALLAVIAYEVTVIVRAANKPQQGPCAIGPAHYIDGGPSYLCEPGNTWPKNGRKDLR